MGTSNSTTNNVNSNSRNTEQKDLETDDEKMVNFVPNSDGESDVMSNEEFARRANEFRRSGAYSRRRTNVRLTLNSAQLLRNDVLSIRRQMQSIIDDNNLSNISNIANSNPE